MLSRDKLVIRWYQMCQISASWEFAGTLWSSFASLCCFTCFALWNCEDSGYWSTDDWGSGFSDSVGASCSNPEIVNLEPWKPWGKKSTIKKNVFFSLVAWLMFSTRFWRNNGLTTPFWAPQKGPFLSSWRWKRSITLLTLAVLVVHHPS